MTLLIFLIFVLVCSAAVKMKFNIRMEEAIVSIIIAIILMTYILGLLSFMYLFVFALIVTFIIAFKYLIENRQRIEIKEIFTLPTLSSSVRSEAENRPWDAWAHPGSKAMHNQYTPG